MKLIIIVALFAVAYANDKIIGGTEMNPGDLKSIVTLKRSGGQFCSATLISNMWLVSAAHCHYRANLITVHAGDYDLRFTDVTEQSQTPRECIQHPSYNSRTLQHDIMLIELSTAFTLDDNVQAATIVGSDLLTTGTRCQVCGWGNTDTSSANWPNRPLCVDITVIDRDVCNSGPAYNGEILDGMVCIGDMAGGVDSCQGDSGGPVYCNHSATNEGTFAAVVSWGYGCAVAMKPGVYSEVAYYRNWIQSNTGV